MALHRTSSMATRRLLAVTVAAGWLLATSLAAEPEGPADDFFESWMAMKADAAKAQAGMSATASYATRHDRLKTVCLKELGQHDCRYVGCPSVEQCGADNCVRAQDSGPDTPYCYNCINHISSVTDLGCCDDDASEYGGAGGTSGDFLAASGYSIGSCDFDVDLLRQLGDTSGYDYSPVRQAGVNAWKAGSAWGTCRITGGGAAQCGSPLCDKLLLQFQGNLYFAGANSKYGFSSNANNDPSCHDLWGTVIGPGGDGGRRLQSTDAATTATTTILAGDALERKLARGVLRRLVNSTTLRNLPISWDRAICRLSQQAAPSNGIAFVMSGPFTVISLETAIEYSAGMLEYVPFFLPACEVNTGVPITPNANDPYVRPNAMKLHFVPSPDNMPRAD